MIMIWKGAILFQTNDYASDVIYANERPSQGARYVLYSEITRRFPS
jgi:hypothetical protein